MPQFVSPRPQAQRLLKPRNPLVAPALMRLAGRHGGPQTKGKQRQSAQRDLQKQIQTLGSPDGGP
ncbi:hypothetical protein HNP55_004076 [Paucibacter oligotrophus]|uniref:Uncharacterized protein n=1 Tax=Roseateles oligotrophus TaxID=1769250 RepID=A0A840LAC1_9BURK|nr:hypothetical protein [Roseateles oligotrophus]MBB4845524.1 hypothetical protein [Roseateles oligotrophus]